MGAMETTKEQTKQSNTEAQPLSLEALEELVRKQDQTITELTAQVKWYQEQFRLLQQKRYGASSEKTTPVEQQTLVFNETEQLADPQASEPDVEQITYERTKQRKSRGEDFSDLPVETIEYELPEDERHCPSCEGTLHSMKQEVRRELKIVPAQVSVVEHIRHIYTCRSCQDTQGDGPVPIVGAPAPKPVLPKTMVSPSLLAHLMSQKYVNGLPLYRQEQYFKRQGIPISRQNMANWMLAGAEQWLRPLYGRMHELLVDRTVLHGDETVLQVLREDGRSATTTSYMWLYRTGRDDTPIVLYDYQTTRASKHPVRFLKSFKGYLQVDGYAGYHALEPEVTLVGCWAHARRKFDEALKALPAEKQDADVPAKTGLEYCNRLFAIERTIREQSLDTQQRHQYRQEHSRPVLEAFSAWIKQQQQSALPKSAYGQALTYCRNQWPKLQAYLEDGRLEIDNNRAERAIKPFVIGRKNWMFCNTGRGAEASAMIYSVIETAKENGLNPEAYLTWLFEQLPNADLNGPDVLDSFMPWSEMLPDNLRKPTKKVTNAPAK